MTPRIGVETTASQGTVIFDLNDFTLNEAVRAEGLEITEAVLQQLYNNQKNTREGDNGEFTWRWKPYDTASRVFLQFRAIQR